MANNDNIMIVAIIAAGLYLYSKAGSGLKNAASDAATGVAGGGANIVLDIGKGFYDSGAAAGDATNAYLNTKIDDLTNFVKRQGTSVQEATKESVINNFYNYLRPVSSTPVIPSNPSVGKYIKPASTTPISNYDPAKNWADVLRKPFG